MKNFTITIIILLLLGIVPGCSSNSNVEKRERNDQNHSDKIQEDSDSMEINDKKRNEDYETASGKNSITGWKEFLEKYPEDKEKEKIEEKLRDLEEEMLYSEACISGDLKLMKEYLSRYPRGKYVTNIRETMQKNFVGNRKSDEEKAINYEIAHKEYNVKKIEAEYKLAKNSKNRKRCNDFLQKYPDSEYSADVKKELEKLDYNDAYKQDTVEAWKKLLKKYPDHKHADKIRNRISNLKDKEIANEPEKAFKDFIDAVSNQDRRKAWNSLTDTSRDKIVKMLAEKLKTNESKIRNYMNQPNSLVSTSFWDAFKKSSGFSNMKNGQLGKTRISGGIWGHIPVTIGSKTIDVKMFRDDGVWKYGLIETSAVTGGTSPKKVKRSVNNLSETFVNGRMGVLITAKVPKELLKKGKTHAISAGDFRLHDNEKNRDYKCDAVYSDLHSNYMAYYELFIVSDEFDVKLFFNVPRGNLGNEGITILFKGKKLN